MGLSEEESAPEAPGVGQRRSRRDDCDGGEEETTFEGSGEEELVGKESQSQGERGERGRREPRRHRKQRHGPQQSSELAQTVLAGGL